MQDLGPCILFSPQALKLLRPIQQVSFAGGTVLTYILNGASLYVIKSMVCTLNGCITNTSPYNSKQLLSRERAFNVIELQTCHKDVVNVDIKGVYTSNRKLTEQRNFTSSLFPLDARFLQTPMSCVFNHILNHSSLFTD